MMKNRIVDEEIMLVRYYPNYKTTLEWYQDLTLCKQVDNRDTAYDLDLLKRMYKYLNKHGDLFYIKYKTQIAITSWTRRGKNLGHGWSRRIYP